MESPGYYILDIISLTDNVRVLDTSTYLDKHLGDMYVVDILSNKVSLLINVIKMIVVSNNAQVIKINVGTDDRYNSDIIDLKNKKLLEKNEIKKLESMTDIEAVKYISNLSKIRWKATEVILGEKELRLGKIVKFQEVVSSSSVVKLSLVTWFLHRIQRVNVIYFINSDTQYIDKIYKNPLKNLAMSWIRSNHVDNYESIITDQALMYISTLKKIKEPLSQMIILTLQLERMLDISLQDKCSDIFKLWIVYKKYDNFDYDAYHKCLSTLEESIRNKYLSSN